MELQPQVRHHKPPNNILCKKTMNPAVLWGMIWGFKMGSVPFQDAFKDP
jgi:hypothetical protein